MTAILIRRVLLLVPVLALVACAPAVASVRAEEPSPAGRDSRESFGPESTLRTVFVASEMVYHDNGKTYDGVDLDVFALLNPGPCYVSDIDKAGACDSGGDTVFVAWHDQAFGAATSDGSGGCLYVKNDGGDHISYGSGSECSGAAALDATSDSWPSPAPATSSS